MTYISIWLGKLHLCEYYIDMHVIPIWRHQKGVTTSKYAHKCLHKDLIAFIGYNGKKVRSTMENEILQNSIP